MRWPGAVAAPALLLAFGMAMAAGTAPDPAALQRGEQVYARCAACHAIEGHRTGPQHCGLFGRRAGTAPGFEGYSQAMRQSGIVWNEKTLDAFLKNPMARLPGTTMGYAGIQNDQERRELITWLQRASRAPTACQIKR